MENIKKLNWKTITSWKNWFLIGALLGIVFILLFNLFIIFRLFEYHTEYFLYGLPHIIILTQLIKYTFLGAFIGGVLKYIKGLNKNLKLICIFGLTIFSLIVISIDLKPTNVISCTSNDMFTSSECLKQLAVDKKDPEICSYLLEEYEVKGCLVKSITAKALSKGNAKVCYGLEDFNDVIHCVSEVAKDKKDESICDQLEDEADECYGEVAIAKKNPGICAPYDEECYKRSLSNGDNQIALCENLKTGDSLWKCYKNIDCSKDNNPKECNDKLDRALTDPGICELEIYDFTDKFECYEFFALKLNNPKFCDIYFKPGLLEDIDGDCRLKLAEINNDSNTCVLNGKALWKCIQGMVEKNDDVSLCKILDNKIESGNCVNKYAFDKNDLEICELSYEVTKDSCVNNILNARRDGKLPDK